MLPRVIPALLLKGEGLVKGIKFKDYTYVGDPINAVKIFNDKEVDELLFLDILATREGRKVSLDLVQKIADECFMPFGVGGGIKTTDDIKRILNAGAEKIAISATKPTAATQGADWTYGTRATSMIPFRICG